VRDEKMLEKLATHDVQDVAELFSLADMCARATESRAWHMPPAPDTAAQGTGKKKNNKKNADSKDKPLAGAPTAAAAMTVAMTAVHEVWCTTLGATTPRSAGRSRSL
jgi:hypothetical protein